MSTSACPAMEELESVATVGRPVPGRRRRRVAFVTNFCSHYRIKPFELLARDYDVDYYFFSDGGEWYWRKEHGVKRGDFRHTYLPGVRVGTRGSPPSSRRPCSPAATTSSSSASMAASPCP